MKLRHYFYSAVLVFALSFSSATAANVTEDFESGSGYTKGESLDSNAGWSVPVGSAVISSDTALSGTQSVKLLAGDPETEITRDLTSNVSSVAFTQLWVRPVALTESASLLNVDNSIIFFDKLGNQGVIFAYDANGAAGAGELLAVGTSAFALDANDRATEWIQLTVRQDFASGLWDLSIDGHLVVINLGIDGPSATSSLMLQVWGDVVTDTYLDDFAYGDENPLGADADKDGILDVYENAHGLNATTDDRSNDLDGDGLSNLEEFLYATSANTSDSDGDGISDAEEIAAGTDPNDPLSPIPATGGITREQYSNITGNTIPDLLNASAYPNSPDIVEVITSFDTPRDIAENFGQRVLGFVTAPVTGDYTFYISSDDKSELWLSTDANPTNKLKVAEVLTYAAPNEWTKETGQTSGTISLVAGQKYYIEALHKEGKWGDHLQVAWSYTGQALQVIPGAYLSDASLDSDGDALTDITEYLWGTDPFDASRPIKGTGGITREQYSNILGNNVYDLTGAATYPDSPDVVEVITSFDTPRDIAEDFGQRVRGFMTAPVTGDYTFYISSDDKSELWLSTDANPTNKLKIASVSGWNSPNEWNKYSEQTSATVSLVAGQRYYIEALHKEGKWGDHLQVAWSFNDQTLQVIPGMFLSDVTVDTDGDGFADSTEYLWGTDPFDPSDPETGMGSITREVFRNINGGTVQHLLDAADYPSNPETPVTTLSSLEAPSDDGADYGQRVHGYLTAPTSGLYTFWISSDDESELWLALDGDPQKPVELAQVYGYVAPHAWDDSASQRSVPVHLVAGERYYIKVLHKEGKYDDHVSVAWSFVGQGREVISGAFLSPIDIDPDVDGLFAAEESAAGTDPLNPDSDGDGLTDYQELQFGSNPLVADTDGDGLDDLSEYNLGTDPTLSDTDGDGWSDSHEVNVTYTDPLVPDNGNVTDLAVTAGDTFSADSGSWFKDGGSVYSRGSRGSLDYTLNIPADGYYRLAIEGQQRNPYSLKDRFTLDVYADGQFVDRVTLVGAHGAPGVAYVYLPFSTAGNHDYTIDWINGERNTFLQIDSVKLQEINGVDGNGNGVDDWLEDRYSELLSISQAIQVSQTSPFCLEGKSAYLESMSILSDYNSNHPDPTDPIVPHRALKGRFYANIELNPDAHTLLTISDDGAILEFNKTVIWASTNIFDGGEVIIRSGDSLKLRAISENIADNDPMTIEVYPAGSQTPDTSYATLVASDVQVHEFTGGEWDVVATVTTAQGDITKTLRVNAKSVNLGTGEHVITGSPKEWTPPSVPAGVQLETDPQLVITSSEAPYLLHSSSGEDAVVLGRIYFEGPIADSVTMDLVENYSDLIGTDQEISWFADGSRLFKSTIELSDVPDDIVVVVEIIRAGVTFLDGTSPTKTFYASDFNEKGVLELYFLKEVTVPGAVCHEVTFE